MKKLVSLLLAALMLLSLPAALAESYTMNEDSFISEQGPVWFYRCYSEEEDAIKDLNLADPALGWGDNWQFSTQPTVDEVYHSMCEWDGIQAMPGKWLGKYVDIVLVFAAPKAGKVTLEPMSFVVKDDGNTYDPYLVQIIHVSGDKQMKLLGEEDFVMTPYETEAMELELAEGDEIRFVVRSSDSGGAAVSVMPTITYAE